MKFKTKSAVLAAGFTAAIITFVKKLIMYLVFCRTVMPAVKLVKKGMMHAGWRHHMIPHWLPMPVRWLVVKPLIAFFVAAAAAWIFVYFFKKLEKKK